MLTPAGGHEKSDPVKRGYVDQPEHWRYSSARDYLSESGLLPVYMAWWEGAPVDLDS